LTLSEMVEMWYKEYKDFNYYENSCARGNICGHYTKMVWGKLNMLGCAIRRCDGAQPTWPKPVYLLVCQYEPQ
uniref:SCP domain-containing protein n=2 Tax=Hymenolepis diminuta TaxID=6216 RepID=A0A0R3SVC7_HYMDI